jgi:Ca-activated chloride channel family protein
MRLLSVACLLGGIAPLAVAEETAPAPIRFQCSLAEPVMLRECEVAQRNYMKISLVGQTPAAQRERAPVNLTLVIDKSGSMQGEKLERAKQALLAAVDRLGPQDIVSIVAYDTVVQVVLPSTKLTDRNQIRSAIQSLEASGNTALFAGICKGAEELRKFRDTTRFSRAILLSDGLANVGPSSPEALAELGTSLAAEGISVTTLGLGLDYNEDLLSRLAASSGGSHAFIANSDQLATALQNEFDDVLSVVASDCQMVIECGPGVRPLRILNGDGTIDGSRVYLSQTQVFGGQERYILLEVELDPAANLEDARRVTANLEYIDLLQGGRGQASQPVSVRFGTAEEVAASQNVDVLTKYELLIADERNRQATQLRDEGQIEEARELLRGNGMRLRAYRSKYKELDALQPSDESLLELSSAANDAQAAQLGEADYYSVGRKQMRELQNTIRGQQSYGGGGKVAPSPR